MAATTEPIEIDPLATLTYTSLGELETRKKLKTVPLAIRAPSGLLGGFPAAHAADGAPLAAGLSAWQ